MHLLTRCSSNTKNQGMKFHGEFQELCEKTLINHCTISQYHFEANELIE
jgi:hypothetical protein